VFAVDEPSSFDACKRWLSKIEDTVSRNELVIMLIGNKSDLGSIVKPSKIAQFATDHGLVYVETSAKSGMGIQEAFDRMFEMIEQRE
jgi:GTPase SAR1 family protein